MKRCSRTTPRVLGFAAGLFPLALIAAGQTTPPLTAEKANEETVLLSPFTVISEADNYYANDSVSGTRTRTELVNLPLSMQVFTDQFIKDIAARDLIDVVVYSSGVSVASGQATNDGDNTSFTLRGQVSFVPMRNGFRRLRVVSTANIDRVEILKGPSSLLYGQLNPGGNVNYITKRPQPTKKIQDLTAQFGSYDLYRGIADLNYPIISGKVAVRVVSSYEDSQSIVARYHNFTQMWNPSLTWWIRPGTSLTVDYEKTQRHINGFKSGIPYNPTIDFEARPGAVDRTFNTHAAGDYSDSDMTGMSIELVHRFNENLLVRGNASKNIWYDNVRQNGGNIALTGANLDLLNRRAIGWGRRGSWDQWRQFELVNNFKVGGVEVQNIAGYQLETLEFRQSLATTQVTASPTVQWNIKDPSTWIVTELTEKDVARASSTGLFSTNVTHSYYATNQLSFLGGKVHTLAGMRYDKFRVFDYSPARAPGVLTSESSAAPAKVPQVGVLFKPLPGLSVYASYSESFLPIYSTSRHTDGSYYSPKPQSGKGHDFGVKLQLFGGKLSGTAAIFQVDNTDILRNLPTTTIVNASGGTESFVPTEQSGTDRSEGFETDLRFRPSKQTQIGVAYAYTDAFVLSDTAANTRVTLPSGQIYYTRTGHWLQNAPRHNASLWFRHELGALGGLKRNYVMGGGTYNSARVPIEAYNVIAGVPTAPPSMRAYATFDLGVGTWFKIGQYNYNASLSAHNIFDKVYLENRYHFGAPRTLTLSVTGHY